MNGGGIDAGKNTGNCTHVIVHNLVYVSSISCFFFYVCFPLIWIQGSELRVCRTIPCVLLQEMMERRWLRHCGLNTVLILEWPLMLHRLVSSFFRSLAVFIGIRMYFGTVLT